MAPGSQKSVLPGIVYLASSRNSRHTSSVFYSRNFLLVFSTFLLVFFVCNYRHWIGSPLSPCKGRLISFRYDNDDDDDDDDALA